ncbi:MAG TPA: flagellar hook-associated protein FlgK [Nitrospiraceae bacterium]|nr:flagellar hook-associated protein FlgK [Nitrospiraceae bacterium]
MSGISQLLGIGQSGIFAFQRALSVTAHNVSNVNTEGYARQEAIVSETRPQDDRPGQVGTGVQVTQIHRSFDTFVDQQLLASQEQLGRFNASHGALTLVEGLFGDSNDLGLGHDLNELFNAFQDVANNPADLPSRSVLLAKSQTLGADFNRTAATLTDQRQALDRQVADTLTEVNGLLGQIAGLNAQIAQAELSGQQANDLRDQRGRLIKDLGERIDVTTVEDRTGQLTVFAGRGQILIDKNTSYGLIGLPAGSNSGFLDVGYNPGNGAPVNISSVVGSGRLRGLLDARDQAIPRLLRSLDTLAAAVATEINRQHRLGFGLDGSTGVDFFSASGLTAGTFAVALTDPKQIAASATATGVPGNNANALAVVDLQRAAIASLAGSTFNDYYRATAADVGTAAKDAAQHVQAEELIHEQLENRWVEVSGVSLDEELVNMIKYQRAFEASSRLIVMGDELLQTILSLKR